MKSIAAVVCLSVLFCFYYSYAMPSSPDNNQLNDNGTGEANVSDAEDEHDDSDGICDDYETDGQNVAQNDALFVHFSGNVQSDGEKKLAVEIFCRQTNDQIAFMTDDEGNFDAELDVHIKVMLHKCTTGLIMAFYKKKPKKKTTNCFPTGILKSPKKRSESKKRLQLCFATIRIKWLKFGTKIKNGEEKETIKEQQQIGQIGETSNDHQASSAEDAQNYGPENAFTVEFDASGKATINGQSSGCTNYNLERSNVDELYTKYFKDSNEVD